MNPPAFPRRRRQLAAALALLALPLLATAQAAAPAWPKKSVRVVVPYPAGGPNDLIARLLAQKLSDRLHQPFVIDNKPGATGMTGTDTVAKSPADGYTLLVSASVHVIYPSLFQKVPFDPLKDFSPVSLIARAPLVLSVNPELNVKSVQELIALARSKPGQLQYASSGNGSATHLSAEAFKTQAGINLQHIAYKGSSPAMNDVIAGHVQLIFDSVGSTIPYIKAGKLRPLAVTSAKRSPAVPDLPTIAESGVPGYDISTWYGLWAPTGTPKEIVEQLSAEVHAILQLPDVREQLTSRGIDPVGSTAAEFRNYNASESTKWARIVKDSGAKLD
ncbi:MAG TPA: tripartite tricarboxylate transporter substrate binding protein [Ramlibacter sp.]|uniref:tripartite tricarboxylate transporter substrate binding protein n=1 Tax=Ramlibacter sp. TaxID=1917967 RepID=UPI002ED21A7E